MHSTPLNISSLALGKHTFQWQSNHKWHFAMRCLISYVMPCSTLPLCFLECSVLHFMTPRSSGAFFLREIECRIFQQRWNFSPQIVSNSFHKTVCLITESMKWYTYQQECSFFPWKLCQDTGKKPNRKSKKWRLRSLRNLGRKRMKTLNYHCCTMQTKQWLSPVYYLMTPSKICWNPSPVTALGFGSSC